MISPPPEIRKFKGLLKWLNDLRKFCIESRPLRSETCEIDERPEGSRILPDIPAIASAAAADTSHPFQVLQQNSGTEESPNWQWKVILESSLYESLQPNDKKAITGLNAWFDAIGNDAIWLGIVFDGEGEITFAQIDSWGGGDDFEIDEPAWSGNNGYCEDDGGDPAKHQTSRKLIAYSVAGEEGEPILTQVMTHDQLLRNVNIDGRPARYPFDHEGGYPL